MRNSKLNRRPGRTLDPDTATALLASVHEMIAGLTTIVEFIEGATFGDVLPAPVLRLLPSEAS